MAINKAEFITVAEMAKMLGVTRAAINKQISEKKIPAEKVGRNYLIPKTALPAGLEERIRTEQKKATDTVIKKSHHHDLDFEKELWAAADKLRGNIDVSEYKNIVLGLLFLKYISDAFYKRREELAGFTRDSKNEDFYVKDDKARAQVLETKDFYKSVGVFYVPEKSRWEYLQTKTMQSDIGQALDKAMDLIEEDNRAELEGVLPKIYTRTTLDHAVIGELVNIFSRISFNHDFDREKDILGRIYEYFLGQFASSEGKRGGEFFTARSIVNLLVEILEPYENARVLDPACGSGGMFVSMGEYLRKHGQDPSKLAVNGQESNQTTLRLAKMNLAIRGLSGKIELGNSYYQDKFPHLQADFVIANPPFNAEWEPSKLADNDPRMTLGAPPGSNANFMWIQHFAHHLAPNGQAGFVMPNGALAVSGREGDLRQKLIEADLVDAIITCPSKLFYNVTLPVSLWFLSKNKSGDRFRSRSGEILFVDARDTFEQISRKQVVFNPTQIQKIANTVRAWRGEKRYGEYKDVPGFCKSVDVNRVKKNHYILSPEKYVDSVVIQGDGISFKNDLENTSKFLKQQTIKYKEFDHKISTSLNEFYPSSDWNNINYSSTSVLESLASKIFDEWFNRYHIPGRKKLKLVEQDDKLIPEEWGVKKLDEVVDISIGRTPPREQYEWFSRNAEDIKWISIKDLGTSGAFILDTEERLTRAAVQKFNISIIPKNTVIVSFKLTVGRVAITTENMLSNEAIAHLKTKKQPHIPFQYLYLLMKKYNYASLASTSSIANAVNSKTIKNIEIAIPDPQTLSLFEKIMTPIFEKIYALQTEERELKKLRNQLSVN
ncbi:MAG: N-6 DNA methylase [Candidatus Sungbacteria bacterium]|nr:N-6 DNA methylase [Candidatus Sungbacteria bacterium]